jgi:endonuclease-3 related protein
VRKRLLDIFDRLLQAYGPRHWWPGDSPLEVMVGAVLTQNTAWRNVEKAIANLRERGLMDMQALHAIGEGELAEVIRPAGFYRVKAKRLKALIDHFCERHDCAVENARRETTDELRAGLLSVKGIGPETADSILLYALDRPVFVVDAYTVRFLRHHGLYEGGDYHDVQRLFMESLPEDARLFNEFHALIVCLGQRHCKKKPECGGCPLADGKMRGPGV